MPAQPPTIYVIAGCNGAGKTTFAREFLPKEVKCLRFLNADEIARGLSQFKSSADVFFIPANDSLSPGIPEIYAHLEKLGNHPEREHTIIRGFPVQLLATHGLPEEAVKEAQPIELNGVQGLVFRAEHLVAIAASVGRTKDRARIDQMLEQSDPDRAFLDAIRSRHHLKLPTQ